jgi:hypothetical protein
MSVEFKCGDPAVLAGYLYDECDTAERAAVEAHLARCPNCAEELTALGATRTALLAWAPPDATLGFRVTSSQDDARAVERNNVVRPARWWQRPMPAWAQVAAAIVIFAIGAILGMRTADPSPAVVTVASDTGTSSVSTKDLAALEQRLRAEMTAVRSGGAPTQVQQVSSSDAAVLQRVRALLAESEQRQQRELALRLGQVLRDVDTQRRMDLTRIEQTFGQMEGFTGPELANQRQMINYLIQRTGAQRPQ